MNSSVMNSQNVILTTAMAVSGAVIFLSLARIKNSITTHQNSPSINIHTSSLRSCLSSVDKKAEKNKKKKRVKFADNVKDHSFINGKKEKKVEISESEKNPEFHQMPTNRAALYHGILRDRVHRIESY